MSIPAVPVTFIVNGQSHHVDVAPHHTLLEVLHDQLGLTGTKECCAAGECGACTLILDGELVDSCLILGVEADGNQWRRSRTGDRWPTRSAATGVSRSRHRAMRLPHPGMLICAKALLGSIRIRLTTRSRKVSRGTLPVRGYSRIMAAVRQAADSRGHE
jgi:carbon-monoxide dehydrogenase small subunit